MTGVHEAAETTDHLDLEEATEQRDLSPPSQREALALFRHRTDSKKKENTHPAKRCDHPLSLPI